MSFEEFIKSMVIVVSSLIPTACVESTPKPIPDIYLSVSPQSLSISQGKEANIFFDLSGSNTTGIKLNVITNTPENDDTSKNISMNIIDNEAAKHITCSNRFGDNPNCDDGSDIEGSFDIKQLGITLSIPEQHPTGTWEMQIILNAWNGQPESDSPSNTAIETVSLTVTESID